MSILLDALKRAEKAKEAAQSQSGHPPASPRAPSAGSLDFAHEPQEEAPAKPFLTREQLPDISQPLEILSADLEPHPPPRAAARTELQLESGPAAAPPRAEPRPNSSRTAAAAPAGRASAETTSRASARRVFEAKFPEPNPRMPFFITLGVLGAFAVGTVVYFWIQLRPPAPLVNTSPRPPANELPAPIVQTPSTATRGMTAQEGVVAGAAAAPARSGPASSSAPASGTRTQRVPRARSAAPVLAPEPAPVPPRTAAGAAAQADAGVRISAPHPVARVHPQVDAGYAAYRAGDLPGARAAYERALADEPANRDALLGIAAVSLRTGHVDTAEAIYRKLLLSDPHDAHAQAGLLAARRSASDPLQTETRLKGLLAGDSSDHVLLIALGNQYARQLRWAEAAQAYGRALTADPDNADAAYNLAVSLDRLHKPDQALQHYRRALATRRGAAFDRESAERRVRELSR